MLTVAKVGGAALAGPGTQATLAGALARVPGPLVVVHGGGPEISAWQTRLGLPVRWDRGLRVTSPEVMQVAAMVLSGWVNKRLVAALLAEGLPAVGLSGEDGALLTATPAAGGRLGRVGEVAAVDVRPVQALLAAGLVPVVSPVSRGSDGEPMNVNADEAAAALAGALGAARLLLVSDVPGVLVEGAVVPTLDGTEAAALLASGAAARGMAVKLRHALGAAAAGVDVTVGGEAILTDPAAGTRVRRAAAVGAG